MKLATTMAVAARARLGGVVMSDHAGYWVEI
jgi:hypothetical protein